MKLYCLKVMALFMLIMPVALFAETENMSATSSPQTSDQEKNLTTISVDIWINASREQVWAAIADFGNVYKIAPDVLQSKLTSAATSGVGITRHCNLSMMGATVDERVIEWTENEYMKVDVYETKRLPVISNILADFTLKNENKGTRVQSTMSYEIKYGFLGKMMNSVMMKGMNRNSMENLMLGIKHYVETGEEVTEDTKFNVAEKETDIWLDTEYDDGV